MRLKEGADAATMLRTATIGVVAGLSLSASALACGFHGYVPQDTMVEDMLTSGHIVLARPAADNPFRYEPVEHLLGRAGPVEIPQLVDSLTRRMLRANPDDTVLFARDSMDGTWQELAYIDPDLRTVVEKVVDRYFDWSSGDDDDRPQFFADLHDHPNWTISELALLELDRVDYADLRTLNIQPDYEAIRARLYFWTESHLKAIRVLLIGLAGDPGAEELLIEGVGSVNGMSPALVGAYATAWLELSGADAARGLSAKFLQNPKVSDTKKTLIIEAMAIHSQGGDTATRQAIAAELETTLAMAPDLAPLVARQFGARNDWSQRDALSDVLKQSSLRSVTDVLLVSQYVAQATQYTETN